MTGLYFPLKGGDGHRHTKKDYVKTHKRECHVMMKTDQSDASARQRVLKATDNLTELEEIRKDSLQV